MMNYTEKEVQAAANFMLTLTARNAAIASKRVRNYSLNKARLARQLNTVWPTKYTYMESKAGNTTFILDTYMAGNRRMVRYETRYPNGRVTTNETTMDNLLHGREFIRVLR